MLKKIINRSIYLSTKNFRHSENSNIGYIKSVITEYPKAQHNLSKTIRKGEKVSSNSSLYRDTKK